MSKIKGKELLMPHDSLIYNTVFKSKKNEWRGYFRPAKTPATEDCCGIIFLFYAVDVRRQRVNPWMKEPVKSLLKSHGVVKITTRTLAGGVYMPDALHKKIIIFRT